MIVKRMRLEEALRIIESFDADAFYSIEDAKYSSAQQEKEIAIPMYSYSGFNRLLRVRLGI